MRIQPWILLIAVVAARNVNSLPVLSPSSPIDHTLPLFPLTSEVEKRVAETTTAFSPPLHHHSLYNIAEVERKTASSSHHTTTTRGSNAGTTWWSQNHSKSEKDAFRHVLGIAVHITGRRPHIPRGEFYKRLNDEQKQQILQVYRSRDNTAIWNLARSIVQSQRGHVKLKRRRWTTEHTSKEVKELKALGKEAGRSKSSINMIFSEMTRDQRLRSLIQDTPERVMVYEKKGRGRPRKG